MTHGISRFTVNLDTVNRDATVLWIDCSAKTNSVKIPTCDKSVDHVIHVLAFKMANPKLYFIPRNLLHSKFSHNICH